MQEQVFQAKRATTLCFARAGLTLNKQDIYPFIFQSSFSIFVTSATVAEKQFSAMVTNRSTDKWQLA